MTFTVPPVSGFRIEPPLALALAMRATPGAYALLLGSGVSRTAGIPTGWEIVLDLLRQVAPEGASMTPSELEAWHRSEFGVDPDYADLLEKVAQTANERRERLRGYFEPTDAEKDEGLKAPTAAHRVIARLAARGYVRVIVTTNFDQLLENALRDQGVTPAIISTTDMVRGAMPLQFERVTILKVHGDYLDTRIKNTPTELAKYDAELNALLDRIFDEYGLVVAGWSATWDPALRAAIMRAPNRRFSTYWAQPGAPTSEARSIIQHRKANLVEIVSADEFFTKLEESIDSLEQIDATPPITKAVAVAAVKRYVPVFESRIRLHDLVMQEVERVRERAVEIIPEVPPTEELFKTTLAQLEGATELLAEMIAVGTHWGGPEHRALWRRAIERLASIPRPDGAVYELWSKLRKYPAQLVFYAAGIAALTNEETLASLLLEPRILQDFDAPKPITTALNVYSAVDHGAAKAFLKPPNGGTYHTPISDHLAAVVRAFVRQFLPEDREYYDAFDRFELLVALAAVYSEGGSGNGWFPLGRVTWRRRSWSGSEPDPIARLTAEVKQEGDKWFLMQHPAFRPPLEDLVQSIKNMTEQANRTAY